MFLIADSIGVMRSTIGKFRNEMVEFRPLPSTSLSEVLKRDPTSSYKKKVIEHLQELEKKHVIDRLTYYHLYPGEAIPFTGSPRSTRKVHHSDPSSAASIQ